MTSAWLITSSAQLRLAAHSSATSSSASQRRAVPFPGVPRRSLPCGAVLCDAVRCCAVLRRAVPCCAVVSALLLHVLIIFLLSRNKNAPQAQLNASSRKGCVVNGQMTKASNK